MHFPVEFNVFHHVVPAHQILEALGYAAAGWTFARLKHVFAGPDLTDEGGLWIIVSCLGGALVGAKGLAVVESIQEYWPYRHHLAIFLSGKTIVGGLAGGWLGWKWPSIFLAGGNRWGIGLCFRFCGHLHRAGGMFPGRVAG